MCRVDAVTGVITTIAGTGKPGFSGDSGPAAMAELKNPVSAAFDSAGNLFVADFGNARWVGLHVSVCVVGLEYIFSSGWQLQRRSTS